MVVWGRKGKVGEEGKKWAGHGNRVGESGGNREQRMRGWEVRQV